MRRLDSDRLKVAVLKSQQSLSWRVNRTESKIKLPIKKLIGSICLKWKSSRKSDVEKVRISSLMAAISNRLDSEPLHMMEWVTCVTRTLISFITLINHTALSLKINFIFSPVTSIAHSASLRRSLIMSRQ